MKHYTHIVIAGWLIIFSAIPIFAQNSLTEVYAIIDKATACSLACDISCLKEQIKKYDHKRNANPALPAQNFTRTLPNRERACDERKNQTGGRGGGGGGTLIPKDAEDLYKKLTVEWDDFTHFDLEKDILDVKRDLIAVMLEDIQQRQLLLPAESEEFKANAKEELTLRDSLKHLNLQMIKTEKSFTRATKDFFRLEEKFELKTTLNFTELTKSRDMD
jgi:hypothetical protein